MSTTAKKGRDMKHKLLGILSAMVIWLSCSAFAQIEETYDLSLWAIVSTVLYGLIGILLFILGYLALDRFVRLDLRRELVEDQNLALGVMLAGFFVALAIIVAAVIR
jgi:uncharacterized membrane protein YjfL (UPF0719 family)